MKVFVSHLLVVLSVAYCLKYAGECVDIWIISWRKKRLLVTSNLIFFWAKLSTCLSIFCLPHLSLDYFCLDCMFRRAEGKEFLSWSPCMHIRGAEPQSTTTIAREKQQFKCYVLSNHNHTHTERHELHIFKNSDYRKVPPLGPESTQWAFLWFTMHRVVKIYSSLIKYIDSCPTRWRSYARLPYHQSLFNFIQCCCKFHRCSIFGKIAELHQTFLAYVAM